MKHLSIKAYGLLFIIVLIIFSFKQTTHKTRKEYLTQNKWQWVKGMVVPAITNAEGDEVNDIYNGVADKCYHDNLFTFNPDGSGSMDEGKLKCPEDSISRFLWTLSEDEFMLTISEEYLMGAPIFTIAKIDEETMTLTWQFNDTKRYFYTDTYKAVK